MSEKVNEIKDKALNKADELYNKLPLDKINDKLGGKVNVKSKKFKIIAAGVLAVLIIVVLCLIFCGGGGAPSSSEISACKSRINRFEKVIGSNRRCRKIADFEKMEPVTVNSQIAEKTGLKVGAKCDRYSCTVTWADRTTSRAVFVRQGKKCGVVVRDWLGE